MAQDKAAEIAQGAKIVDYAACAWNWGTPAGSRRLDRRAEYCMSLARLDASKKVLEIGCGTGLLTRRIAPSGAPITAIDISRDLISRATRDVVCNNVEFKICDVDALPFEDNSFDVALGTNVLHHLDVPSAMKEIYRVLKSDGVIVFSEPNIINPQIMIQRCIPLVRYITQETKNEKAFFRVSLGKFLRRIGFSSVRIDPYDFLHPLVPPALIQKVERLSKILERVLILKEFAGSLLIFARKARPKTKGERV
ncbi:MAG: class I SAM-dependent methyltransferase [Candidatus Omnitrophica bacterium]|nr:class I SAM-dependent methyltransferase [Candidatus Omnitrophota bacterium]